LAVIHPLDKTTTNLDVVLQDGITLSTKVTDTDGRLLTNATATVTLWQGNRGYRVTPQPVTADEHGNLRIAALPQGQKYWVQIEATNHDSDTLRMEADETKTNLLKLPPVVLTPTDGEVSGRVLDTDGKPAVGVSVHLFQGGGQTTTTDANGRFAFHGVRRGLVSFDAGLPQPNTSAYKNSGMARGKGGDTNIVIRLGTNPDPGSAISQARITTSGMVFDPSNKPAPGVFITMFSSGGLRSTVQSDANGKYTAQWQTLFISNNSGKAEMFARDPAHNLAATSEVDTNTTSLDLHLQPGLTLAGEVRDSDGGQVTNAIVQLVPFPPADPAWGINRQTPTNASPKGLFFFSTLPQGAPYRVNVSADGYGSSSVTAKATDTQTTQFRLPTVVLNHANQQLAGQVIGADGKPCWGAEVTVSGDGQPAGRISHSDASGHFVITEVCTGLLDVRVDPPARAVVRVQAHGGDTNIVVKLGQ
jgi:protocatechuate 3,4-dioxygenase beta subunit